jgi:putative chitinase
MLTNSKFEPFLEEVFSKYQINTPLRKAHFLAQLKHESGNFTRVQESFNYKTNQRLFDIFPKYFDKDKNRKMSLSEAQTINSYIGKPEKLANFLYANRMGNGNEASGDGRNQR